MQTKANQEGNEANTGNVRAKFEVIDFV